MRCTMPQIPDKHVHYLHHAMALTCGCMWLQLRLDLMVSAHVRSRWKGVPYASSQIGNVVRAYEEWLVQKADRMHSRDGSVLG